MNKIEKIKAYGALAAVCFFWGTTYFGIKIAVHDLPPFFLGGIRHLIAGSLMCAYFILYKKEKIPSLNELKKIFIMGLFLILGANCLVNWAELYVPSGLAALLCAFLPFYILIINLFMRNAEPINIYSASGMLIGLLSMLLIFYQSIADISNIHYMVGIMLVIIANISWAIGTVFVKKSGIKTNILFASGLQMVMMGIFISVISFSLGEFENVKFTHDGIYALAYLVIFGSIIGFSSYAYAVSKLPTTLVSIYAYINPVVAVLLGSIFLKEKNSPLTYIAMIFTLSGVFLINYGYQKSALPKKE